MGGHEDGTDLTSGLGKGSVMEASNATATQRGVSRRSLWKGVLARFLPSATLITGAYAALEISASPERWATPALFFGSALVALTAGFALGLEGLRRWLYKEAGVANRRSVIAGLMAPMALFIIAVFDASAGGVTLVDAMLYSLLAGIALAGLMFFPWLSSPSTETTSSSSVPPAVDGQEGGAS